MKIKFAYGIVPGAVSGGQETECRDMIRTACEKDAAVIFLAGPAAGIAAELTAERFDELYASDEEFIKETLFGDTEGEALLFAAVKGSRYLAGHMGGGLIARLDGSCSVLSEPEGEGIIRLRIYRGEVREPFGFLLMSGGACRSLYEPGTETLSPACITFFEWLKEYDEETVSEALTDNISKYFLKDVKGGISVGMMMSAAGTPEEGGKGGSIFKYLIAALVILAVIFVFAMKPDIAGPKGKAKPEAKPPAASSEGVNLPEADLAADPNNNEPSVTFSADNPVSYDAGEYQVGEDIPAGEYFFWTGEMLKPDSIKVNGVTCLSGELYCMTVETDEGETLTTDVRFTAAENVGPVKAANGTLISGKYKIGKDIAPGTYKILPTEPKVKGKYYSILDGEISNDEAFGGETAVVVPDEGYIVFYRSVLVVNQE